MNDEEWMSERLRQAGFQKVATFFEILHPTKLPRRMLNIDSIGIKGSTIFIFESSRTKLDTQEIKDIAERYFVFRLQRIALRASYSFTEIRVFHHNPQTQRLIEVNGSGRIIKTLTYTDTNKLVLILANR